MSERSTYWVVMAALAGICVAQTVQVVELKGLFWRQTNLYMQCNAAFQNAMARQQPRWAIANVQCELGAAPPRAAITTEAP